MDIYLLHQLFEALEPDESVRLILPNRGQTVELHFKKQYISLSQGGKEIKREYRLCLAKEIFEDFNERDSIRKEFLCALETIRGKICTG